MCISSAPTALLCLQTDLGLPALDCRKQRVSRSWGWEEYARRGLLGYRPQRCLILALSHLDPTDQSAQSTVKTFCGTEPPTSDLPLLPLSPLSIQSVRWAADLSPRTPACLCVLTKAVSPSLSPHPCVSLSGCPVLFPLPSALAGGTRTPRGPSLPPSCALQTHNTPSPLPIPTKDSGPQGPILRENFHPPHPSPLLPLPQRAGYILSQGMSGSHRHFLGG